ncbi:hypothetical protein [Luteimonas saliphila]|uniref:hypothetical protein n=1 Tax=Luteimonas saliphila TaxID=2804919 RepID=UPI001EE1CFCF|nr:hypothetical protein [Luteimonas saliphila]
MEGFPTAAAAEEAGLRLAQALLIAAVSMNFGLVLNYHTHEPAVVFDRYRPSGASMSGEGHQSWGQSIVVDEIVDAYSVRSLDRAVFLSMELYCAGLLDLNERTRFITLVSALEPLAKQEGLGPAVDAFVEEAVSLLRGQTGICAELLLSLQGRLLQLKKTSVRQALFRLSDTWFPGNRDIRAAIDRAYSLRSQLLHEGALSDPDTDLMTEASLIAGVLREMYAKICGRELRS